MVHLCGKRYAQRAGETTEIKVYSNLPTVALYMNGQLVEEKEVVDKIARFEVALAEGFNIFMAAAGDVKDTMTLEKVDAEPEIYTLPGVEDDGEGAANWFTQMGDMDLVPEMQFPEGKYSVKNKLAEIYKNPEAWKMFIDIIKFPLSPEHGMWGMISNFTVEGMLEMSGELPQAAVAMINAKLNEYDVVE